MEESAMVIKHGVDLQPLESSRLVRPFRRLQALMYGRRDATIDYRLFFR